MSHSDEQHPPMHPAYSVILFTTASGAGYGLLVWLGIWIIRGSIGHDAALALTSMAISLGLVTIGLLSSTFHLGRPTRAWRAFSQWRTSWLSREGVAAVATFFPAVLLAAIWFFWRAEPATLATLLAMLSIALALVTVWCTGMIYQSLPTIPSWNQPIVAPVYVALALASGAVLLSALLLLFGHPATMAMILAIVALLVALGMKLAFWSSHATPRPGFTAGEATGLGKFGRVRMTEAPHSRDNFVMREMGYAVARKHAARLRLCSIVLGFVAPALLMALALVAGGIITVVLVILAVVSTALGLVTERWLFFAEAKHVVTLFYGEESL